MKLNERFKLCIVVLLIFCSTMIYAQQKTITGIVTDEWKTPLPGVTVIVKGTKIGAVTDFDGQYAIKVAKQADILVFSYVGMATKEIPVSGKSVISTVLVSTSEQLEDVVIVGYGAQKKESVVGAITSAKGEDLMKSGGVTNVGEALQGKLPGVVAINSSGLPGQTDPKIFIRGQSTWNGGGQPLILVDGVERPMGDLDLNEIDQISVLKDASATAVFGVKGANGVILITTKRGKSGKAQLSLSGNVTLKTVSKLPKQLDSYDAIFHVNEAIMREVALDQTTWDDIVPYGIQEKYRNPSSLEESYKYPNVDWQDVVLKDLAKDSRVNLSVSGGSDFAKYFGSLSYQTTRDIFKGSEYDNGKGYSSEYRYNRFNYRSNLDFNISKTTKFSVNLSGYYGKQEKPTSDLKRVLSPIYQMASSLYTPIYPDGYYGAEVTNDGSFINPLITLTQIGYDVSKRIQVNSDFKLNQKLDFITDGLSLNASLSYDNNMSASQEVRDKGADNLDNVIYRIYDKDGNETILSPTGINDFDYVIQPWTISTLNVGDGSRARRLNYQFSLNYANTFAKKHNTTALFLFQREQYARGSMFPSHREDWVGRLTYNYDNRYFIDVNGAYNGSEKYGPGYRFELFPSVAAGWTLSNENFLKDSNWVNKLKIRGSYGLVGDDNSSGRFRYQSQWSSGGSAMLVPSDMQATSPYSWYAESVVGNTDLHWETAIKQNLGIEMSLFDNLVTAEFDYFKEDREDVVITGNSRAVPDFYGISPPDANTGAVKVNGFEITLGLKHRFANDMNLWSEFSYTRAKDKVIAREDPFYKPSYQKDAGYQIGQPTSALPAALLESWDDIYMSTPDVNGEDYRRPGYYDLIDYNGDGEYNGRDDNAPWGYSDRPQNTWTCSLGGGYRGFNFMVMFYGAQNANKIHSSRTFTNQTYLFYNYLTDYWTPENRDTEITLEPWSIGNGGSDPARDRYDATVVRLRTAELSYDVPKSFSDKLGVSSLKFFVNGNNLFLWTNVPDDREFNGSNTADSTYRGDYPTLKRFNLGFNLNF